MKIIRFWLCICVFLFVHNHLLIADETVHNDSLYTAKYINSIYIAEPERALQLLDEAENRRTIPLQIVNELRSLSYRSMYMNKLAFLYARKSYMLDSISQREPKHLLKMTVYLAELSYLMSKYEGSMRYVLDGITQAKELGDRESEARLLFCIGENKMALSFNEEGYDYFNRAIKLLYGTKDMREMMLLSYFYGIKMGYLMTDSRNKEALEIALEREALIKEIEALPQVPDGYVDGQKTYLFSKMAYLCYKEEKYELAENYYQRYLATAGSQTPDGKVFSIPYLQLSKQYGGVIDNCRDFKELMRKQQDTINAQYVTVLQKEVEAYLGLQKYKEAAALRGTIMAIKDSINNRDKENTALELHTVYDVAEKKEHIEKQAFLLKIRNISLAFLICIVCLTLFILWRMRHYNNVVKCKNKVLIKFVNEKLADKEKSSRLLNMDNQKDILSDLETEDLSPEEMEELLDEEDKKSGEEAENKKIFMDLNNIVLQKQLYLSPELLREDLAQIVHLNNARFARMIKECTGTNFNGYINDLRIDYAIKLLKQHPNYTIRAIADESGFNSTPILYSLFKKKTGMTPYEFKKAQESL